MSDDIDRAQAKLAKKSGVEAIRAIVIAVIAAVIFSAGVSTPSLIFTPRKPSE